MAGSCHCGHDYAFHPRGNRCTSTHCGCRAFDYDGLDELVNADKAKKLNWKYVKKNGK
jgi:hypothetical protein